MPNYTVCQYDRRLEDPEICLIGPQLRTRRRKDLNCAEHVADQDQADQDAEGQHDFRDVHCPGMRKFCLMLESEA